MPASGIDNNRQNTETVDFLRHLGWKHTVVRGTVLTGSREPGELSAKVL